MMPSAAKQSGSRAWTGLFIAAGVLVVLGVVVAHRVRTGGFEWAKFWSTFVELDWGWFTASIVFVMLTYVGRAIRWSVMLRPLKARPSYWNLFSATVIGFTAVVLFGRAGELVRPYLIAVKEKVPFSSQLAAWFLERVYDLLIVLLVFGFALSRVQDAHVALGPSMSWVMRIGGGFTAALATLCVVLLFLFSRSTEWVRRRMLDALGFLEQHRLARVERLLTAFLDGVGSTRTRSAVLLLILYTFLEWAVIAASLLCLFKAVPETSRFSVNDVLMFLGFIAFGSVVQIPGVGGGMQVASVVVLTEVFGMALERAGAIALLVWVVSFVVVVPPGLALALYEGVNWGKLKHLDQEVSGA